MGQSAHWISLNDQLRDGDESTTRTLLQQELRGACRLAFLMRIHARLNVLRAHREREELRAQAHKVQAHKVKAQTKGRGATPGGRGLRVVRD